MSNSIQNKIDFALIFKVKNANPNGDPLNGNRPRQTYDGFGEVSDVCLKRKIRNRLQNGVTVKLNGVDTECKENIFVQSDYLKNDGFKSLEDRYKASIAAKDKDGIIKEACEKWFDVRSFGQIFPYGKQKGKKANNNDDGDADEASSDGADAVSIGIRGPVTIQSAFTLETVAIMSSQITKSVSGTTTATGKKASDTMGQKHRVESAYYVTYGSINCQPAEKTGFSEDDALKIKEALRTLFRDDAASARPDGSMEVVKVIWATHKNSKNGKYPSAKVHRGIDFKTDGSYTLTKLDGIEYEEIDGE
jgi:CRISPR-associated protein Csd2